jgi:hypothetical protein
MSRVETLPASTASSAVATLQQTRVKENVFNIFKNRTKNYSWSILDSAKVDQATDDVLRKYHIPKPSHFTRWKRIRRNIYIFSTLNGAIVNWYYFFQPLILVSFTGVFIVIFSNTVQINGRREFDFKNETLLKFEIDIEFLINMTIICIFGVVLAYSVPKFLTIIFNESEAHRHRRQQYINLMTRILKYDPYSDLHELDYCSDVDPVSGYLWFLYFDFAVNLTRDYLFEYQKKSKMALHPANCDCILDTKEKTDMRMISGMGYDGQLQCTQKIQIVVRVVKVLRQEFPKKTVQDEEDELIDSLCQMALQSYDSVLTVVERGPCGALTSCIKRFSIQPPRGSGAYSKNS